MLVRAVVFYTPGIVQIFAPQMYQFEWKPFMHDFGSTFTYDVRIK